MSRYNVSYKPGGAIAKPLSMAIKMQRITPVKAEQAPAPSGPAPECVMDPVLWWFDGDSTESYVIGYVRMEPEGTVPVIPFFYAARLFGELCWRDNDVVLEPVWQSSVTFDSGNGPAVWTYGNILIVTHALVPWPYPYVMAPCDPGFLTVTASIDGEPVGSPITLEIRFHQLS